MIISQIVTTWATRTPILYRYLNECFVDQFFRTGALRLGSFAAFRRHPDEERLDAKEGRTLYVSNTQENGGQALFAHIRQGEDAYVLCGSTVYDETLRDRFACDSCIQINDTTAFGMTISKYIPGFLEGLEGPCIYRAHKAIQNSIGYVDPTKLGVAADTPTEVYGGVDGAQKADPARQDQRYVAALLAKMTTMDALFLKPHRYEHQREYRLLWRTAAPIQPFIDIVCPDARQFCSRVDVSCMQLDCPGGLAPPRQ